MQRRDLINATGLAAFAAALPRAAAAQPGRPGLFGAKGIAEAGFIFGLPIVMNYAVMYEFCIDRSSPQFKAPFNTLYNDAQVFTWRDTAIPTPNSDTPYSMVWMDLRAEPMVLTLPAIDPKRYVSVQFVDGNTYNYAYAGSRTTGNGGGSFMVAGPNWRGTPPAGVRQVFRCATQFSFVILRTQLFDPADLPNVVAIQKGYKAQPLSAFLGRPAPAPAPAIAWPRVTAELVKTHFFAFLDFALQFNPAQRNEREIRRKLARIGVGDTAATAAGGTSLLDRLEIDLGLFEGNRKLEAAVAAAGTGINGWRVTAIPGTMQGYDGDWLQRAVVAKAGIYGNTTEEAAYPFTRHDQTGAELDGSKGKYTITFPADALPPVNAFWSVTMYDGKTQLLIRNPIDRYLINSPMLPNLKRNADGSLTLYVQHESPGPALESNWLPAPNGPIYMVMRLYWPRTEQPSLLPVGTGQWKPPGVVKQG